MLKYVKIPVLAFFDNMVTLHLFDFWSTDCLIDEFIYRYADLKSTQLFETLAKFK